MNYFFYFLAIICLSQAGNLARLAAAPPEAIGFWRLLTTALILLLFSAAQKKSLRPNLAQLNNQGFLYAVVSGIFFFIHLWTYKYAAQNTTIANGMILFATNPLFTAFITTVVLKERFHTRYLISYLLAIISIYLLLSQKMTTSEQGFLGNISAILSAFLYSVYIISGRQARKDLNTFSYTSIVYLVAALCFYLFALYRQTPLTGYEMKTWISILLLVLFPTLLGHVIFSYLLKKMDINWMSTGKLLEPILSATMAYFLFQESLSEYTTLSYILTALAIFILFEPWKRLQKKYFKSVTEE